MFRHCLVSIAVAVAALSASSGAAKTVNLRVYRTEGRLLRVGLQKVAFSFRGAEKESALSCWTVGIAGFEAKRQELRVGETYVFRAYDPNFDRIDEINDPLTDWARPRFTIQRMKLVTASKTAARLRDPDALDGSLDVTPVVATQCLFIANGKVIPAEAATNKLSTGTAFMEGESKLRALCDAASWKRCVQLLQKQKPVPLGR